MKKTFISMRLYILKLLHNSFIIHDINFYFYETLYFEIFT
jgi:hypothetical protein